MHASCRNLPHGFFERELLGEQVHGNSMHAQHAWAHHANVVAGSRMVKTNGRCCVVPPLSAHVSITGWHNVHTCITCCLTGFFSQFGKLTRVRLSRNKKTGKAKHYAFLEFQYPEVRSVHVCNCACVGMQVIWCHRWSGERNSSEDDGCQSVCCAQRHPAQSSAVVYGRKKTCSTKEMSQAQHGP